MIGLVALALAVATAPVQVMVLGTYHFDNPGLDVVNVKVDDVTAPHRQRELAALADAIAAFRPTRVMVETERPGPSHDVTDYARFTPARLGLDRNEITQIGYRIAYRAGLKSVQGIDEQGGAGEPDYFPFDRVQAYAASRGKSAELTATTAGIQRSATETEALMPTTSIPALLDRYNDPTSPAGGQSFYYALLRYGDGAAQPGADLNAMWYLRNAKIFSKLVNVARPGDRIVVVYGAGHGYWLRHFAAMMPGYVSVDVRPYLAEAAARIAR